MPIQILEIVRKEIVRKRWHWRTGFPLTYCVRFALSLTCLHCRFLPCQMRIKLPARLMALGCCDDQKRMPCVKVHIKLPSALQALDGVIIAFVRAIIHSRSIILFWRAACQAMKCTQYFHIHKSEVHAAAHALQQIWHGDITKPESKTSGAAWWECVWF